MNYLAAGPITGTFIAKLKTELSQTDWNDITKTDWPNKKSCKSPDYIMDN